MSVNYEKDLETRCEQLEEVIKKQQEHLEDVKNILENKVMYFVSIYADMPRRTDVSEMVPKKFRTGERYSNHLKYSTYSFDSACCFIKANERWGSATCKDRLWKIVSNCEDRRSLNPFHFEGSILISSDLKQIETKIPMIINKSEQIRLKKIESRIREIFSMDDDEADELWRVSETLGYDW